MNCSNSQNLQVTGHTIQNGCWKIATGIHVDSELRDKRHVPLRILFKKEVWALSCIIVYFLSVCVCVCVFFMYMMMKFNLLLSEHHTAFSYKIHVKWDSSANRSAWCQQRTDQTNDCCQTTSATRVVYDILICNTPRPAICHSLSVLTAVSGFALSRITDIIGYENFVLNTLL